MPIDPELLALLRCPETLQPLSPAGPALLERARNEGWLDRSGNRVSAALQEALVRQDGRLLFPIEEGLPILLLEAAVPIPE